MRSLVLSTLLAIVAVVSPPARAADLETALSLESSGRLVEALEAFEEALESRGNTTSGLITIYQHLSMLRFAASDQPGAREALMCLRALDREASLPALAPPEVVDLLEEVSSEWGDRALSVDLDVPPVEPGASAADVSVRVLDDLPGLVRGVQIRLERQVLARGSGGGPFQLTINLGAVGPGERPSVVLLDEHGGVLLERELEIPTQEAPPPPPPPQTPPYGSRGAWVAGWVLLASGVAAVAAGAVLVAIDGRPTGEERATGTGGTEIEEFITATGGWVSVGVGAAALVTGVVLLILRPGRARAEEAVEQALSGVVARW